MSELDLKEIPVSSQTLRFLEGLRRLKLGEVLTVFLDGEGDPDELVDRVRGSGRKWDFQKQRQGDGSWLIHAKLSRRDG